MTTTPLTFVENWITLIKAHEKLLIVGVAAVLLFHFYGAGLNAWIHHDEGVQAVAEKTLALQVTANQNLATENAALVAQVTASNAALAKAATARDAQTKTQQITDQTLPLPALGQRWETLVHLQPLDITPTADGALRVSDVGSRATVTQLELIPGLQADLAGETTVAAGDEKVIAGQTTQIAGLNLQLVDAANVCKDELATEKAKAKRSAFRWFKVGVVAGFVGGLFVGHSI